MELEDGNANRVRTADAEARFAEEFGKRHDDVVAERQRIDKLHAERREP